MPAVSRRRQPDFANAIPHFALQLARIELLQRRGLPAPVIVANHTVLMRATDKVDGWRVSHPRIAPDTSDQVALCHEGIAQFENDDVRDLKRGAQQTDIKLVACCLGPIVHPKDGGLRQFMSDAFQDVRPKSLRCNGCKGKNVHHVNSIRKMVCTAAVDDSATILTYRDVG